MAYPQQTFSTIAQLLNYINTLWVTNGNDEITGVIGNNVVNALANFIVSYEVNGSLANISTSSGVVTVTKPITAFTVGPTSVNWPDNVQNEYYLVNATGNDIPLTSGYSYVDQFFNVQTILAARDAVHIAKATNGSWIRVNNQFGGGGGGGSLPPQSGNNGRVLFTNGSTAAWGDPVLQISGTDVNWTNSKTWVNGSTVFNPQFNSPHFALFWNDIPRFLLQNISPPEWHYISNGFVIDMPGFDHIAFGPVNLFLLFKGSA